MWHSIGQIGFHLSLRPANSIEQSLLQLAIGVDINGIGFAGQRCGSVFAEIKPGDARGPVRAPVRDPEVAVLAFVYFAAGRHKAKLAGPIECEVVHSEGRGVAKVWIPALPCADEKNAVAVIAYDIAVI